MVLFKLLINHVAIIVNLFTFHYGPIQIKRNSQKKMSSEVIYIPLWSYSNLTLEEKLGVHIVHLHSTMVLFKSAELNRGSFKDRNLHSTMVLFK